MVPRRWRVACRVVASARGIDEPAVLSAVPAQPDAAQPRGRVADVPVLVRRRPRDAVAPAPPRLPGALGRGHAVHRGPRRRARRADLAGGSRSVGRRDRGGAAAGDGGDPRALADPGDDAARARGPQGIDARAHPFATLVTLDAT